MSKEIVVSSDKDYQWIKEIIMYTLVHRFNNRWRWCRFASSIFKTMQHDMHKLEFKNSKELLNEEYFSFFTLGQ